MNQTNPISEAGIVEINLSDILSFFKRNWLVLLLTGLLFGAIGYGISYLVPEEFEATAKILPEYGAGNGAGGLSDLASLAGLSLGNTMSDALRPDLYPSILSSKPFLLKVLSTPFPLQDGKRILLVTYLDKEAKPFTPEQLAQSDTLISMSREQEGAMKELTSRITASVDKMTGILSLRIEMPDPKLAAACATFSLAYLTNFVNEYRGGKKLEKVAFLRQQTAEAKVKYQRAEMALNTYRDRNRNTYSNVAQVEEQRLQTDFMQAQALYGQLTQQVEAARLQAMEDAPVIKVLEPPMVSNWRSSPKRRIYALGFAMLGGLITIAYLLIRRK
jgi:uncharacterized protein involved in exopolysaccharide biosynthesis